METELSVIISSLNRSSACGSSSTISSSSHIPHESGIAGLLGSGDCLISSHVESWSLSDSGLSAERQFLYWGTSSNQTTFSYSDMSLTILLFSRANSRRNLKRRTALSLKTSPLLLSGRPIVPLTMTSPRRSLFMK